MKDVTEIVDHYRITARSLWNTAFGAVSDLRTPEAREQFDEINLMLFDGLVLARLEQEMERTQLFRSPIRILGVIILAAARTLVFSHWPS
jgi:hypothetical protein